MNQTLRRTLTKTVVLALSLGATQAIATEHGTSALENAEAIKIVSQSIPKDYFYIEQNIQASSAKKLLRQDLLRMDNALSAMKKNPPNEESKNLVEFMLLSVDELKSTLNEPYNAGNGGLVLDYTETLLEGSENIAKHARKKVSGTVFDKLEEMKFLLARIAKYYIAFRAGYTDDINVQQSRMAVDKFESLLKEVKKTKFTSPKAQAALKTLVKYWPASKSFYLGIKQSELPTIVFISTKYMEKALDTLIDNLPK